MKRVAAIVGSTPSFVRWAIRYDCPFRDNTESELPWQTFRQLRSLREASIATLEQRVVDGFCVHAEYNEDPETARGFPIDEIMNFFADEFTVDLTCGNCPANAAECWSADRQSNTTQKSWAGCYGWLPARTESVDFPESFNQVISHGESDWLNGFPPARDAWFRIWQINVWDSPRLEAVIAILQQIQTCTQFASADLNNLNLAFNACLENKLVLETELVPRGESDGIEWQIEPHCSICRAEMLAEERICGQCGRRGFPNPATKRKVLGLRPYMLLRDLIGREATAELLLKFRELKTSH